MLEVIKYLSFTLPTENSHGSTQNKGKFSYFVFDVCVCGLLNSVYSIVSQNMPHLGVLN